jgi:hypothetical protein
MEATAEPMDGGFAAEATYDYPPESDAPYDLTGGMKWTDQEIADLPSSVLGARPKPRLTEEEAYAKEVARRRQFDLERRQRVFDAKRRTIGLDKEALDAQVAERRDRDNMEKAYNRMGDRDAVAMDKHLKMMETEKQRRQRQREIECKEYSLKNIHYESRREFDLNDPLAKRKAVPDRVGDDDPRCGPSSMQKFNGEDLMKEERIRQQRLAQVSFIEQQKFEKAMLARKPDDGFASQVEEVTALRNNIEEKELALRLELTRKQHAENLYQAAENEEKRKALARANVDANEQELAFHSTDKFLNECAPSHYNTRVIRDAYKGSTRGERMEVANQQRNQVLERELMKATEDHESRQFANTVEMTRKQMVAMERDKQRRRRELTVQMAQDNKKLQAEQHLNLKQQKQIFTNEFSPDFFAQFGRDHR